MDLTVAAIVVLAAISAGAITWGLLYNRLEVEKKTENRVRRVKSAETDRAKIKASRDRIAEISKRRKSVQDSLRDLERKQVEKNRKAGSGSVKTRLIQAGLSISPRQFFLMGGGFGLFIMLVVLLAGFNPLLCLGVGFIAGVGLPHFGLNYLLNRRKKKFLEEFPNALDVMVRSIKSGLPLNDALRLIAADGQEPVRSEFRRAVESQQMGLSVADACARIIHTMPLQEVNFFSIVIAIQSQAGGNLSEALANLSRVLRERRKMRAKVNALSMEAKASAVIIGALPFIVALLVYLTSPDYISVLFNDVRGHIILGVSGVWMSIGILVMRNMINFDI
ncbi:type II secretion system F family protein [Rhizobiaceae bacterium BDR2-2]|uniref:Type II secretion system F family protein n=1 Tax=Ectorhizobium quercum TaxID=2965071 RepID=A0AAE3MWH6_9HYPH|nr:type II secretion system F family protein [Ectorhizobium quercum]MCX8995691.1 type II secretion system F family protein [Ectorhizobium quercum]